MSPEERAALRAELDRRNPNRRPCPLACHGKLYVLVVVGGNGLRRGWRCDTCAYGHDEKPLERCEVPT